jgi:hypothetical protein
MRFQDALTEHLPYNNLFHFVIEHYSVIEFRSVAWNLYILLEYYHINLSSERAGDVPLPRVSQGGSDHILRPRIGSLNML